MLPIHWRLAELTVIKESRELYEDEQNELNHCLQVNATFARKLAEQYNFSLMASMTDDTEWLFAICADIDKLEIEYKIKKPASYNEN